ncbi:MAG: Hsp20/alpha crystallin family protein [Anaerolineales bacterium]|jgi:HSP20 family protein
MSSHGVDQDRIERWLASDDDPWRDTIQPRAGWMDVKRSHVWRPPTDVLENENSVYIQVEIAGMRGGEISITYEGEVLSIRGSRNDTRAGTEYHQLEIPYGDFAVDIKLPVPIESDNIEATYGDGFLRVTLPKAQPKRVPINS